MRQGLSSGEVATRRHEFVVLMGESHDGQKQQFLPIIRNGIGRFFGFGESEVPDMDEMKGWMRTTAYRRWRNSSLPTMARLEMGEVLLTTSMSEVFLRLRQSVLPGNAALRESYAKSVLIQIGHASAHGESQPAGQASSICI